MSRLVSIPPLLFQLLLGTAAYYVCLTCFWFNKPLSRIGVMIIACVAVLAFVSVAVAEALLKMRIRGFTIASAFTFAFIGTAVLFEHNTVWTSVFSFSLFVIVLLFGLSRDWMSRTVMAKRANR